MEPVCHGCSARLKELQSYWTLQMHVKGKDRWYDTDGPAYCEVCMDKMVFLLLRDYLHAASEEEG